MRITEKLWTYGVEHELGDWDTRKGWEGFGRDKEPNICNSNGIAGDPTLKDYPFGAEINTPPTSSPESQGEILETFCSKHKHVYVSCMVGMHIHIRLPGLREWLPGLKALQRYAFLNQAIFQVIDPIPFMCESNFSNVEQYKAHRRWVHRIRKSHWTFIPENRVEKQMKTKSPAEFFNAEPPVSKTGKPLFHAQPRASINLRQILQTDTIEFRHFFQTLNPVEVVNAVSWCRDFLLCAFDRGDIQSMYEQVYLHTPFPSMPLYEHWIDKRWQATTHSKNTRAVVRENIIKILDGTFDTISNKGFKHLNFE